MDYLKTKLLALNKESRKIYNLIQKFGPITKNEILDKTGMKLTTLNRFMDSLKKLDLIAEIGIGDSCGGRKPVLYDIKASGFYSIGVEISRLFGQVTLVNAKNEMVIKERFTMDESSSPSNTVDRIFNIIDHELSLHNIDIGSVIGIGIGTVGPLDRENGIILNPSRFQSSEWVNVPIAKLFKDRYSIPVFIDNGANTGALAEYIYGVGKEFLNIAYINCGIGIRTGAISKGMIIRTINDTEDAFGHMVIDVDGNHCICGNYGCIDTYSSLNAITNKFISEVKKGRTTQIQKSIEDIKSLDILKAAEDNDSLAKEVVFSAAGILGTGISNYINLLAPQMVILSGPLINMSKLFYDTCIEVANKKSYLKGKKEIYFSNGGEFSEDAISMGAAIMVFENLINLEGL